MWYLEVVWTQIHKNQGTSLHDKCLVTSLQYIISQVHDIVRWICCKKWNKGKNGNTSKPTKSSNHLYNCNIFSKNIWKHALIIVCTRRNMGWSFSGTNFLPNCWRYKALVGYSGLWTPIQRFFSMKTQSSLCTKQQVISHRQAHVSS